MLTHTSRGKRLLGGAVLLLAGFTATLMPTQSQAVIANQLTIDSVGGQIPDTPGARDFAVAAGTPVSVKVTNRGLLLNPSPIALFRSTQLRLTVTSGPDAGDTYDATMPAGASTATFTGVTFDEPAFAVGLRVETVSGGTANPGTAEGDVLGNLASEPASTQDWTWNGEEKNTGTNPPCPTSEANPVCIELKISDGTSTQYLGLSPCDPSLCLPGSEEAFWLADTAGATNQIIMYVDRSIRHDGDSGVPRNVTVEIEAGAGYVPMVDCLEGGAVPPGEDICLASATAIETGDLRYVMFWIRDGKIRIQ